jgi:hypothetical protein
MAVLTRGPPLPGPAVITPTELQNSQRANARTIDHVLVIVCAARPTHRELAHGCRQ